MRRCIANHGTPAGAEAQVVLTAMRRAVTSAPLIPGLKALVARHTGDESWTNIRPPHLKLAADAAAKLFDDVRCLWRDPGARRLEPWRKVRALPWTHQRAEPFGNPIGLRRLRKRRARSGYGFSRVSLERVQCRRAEPFCCVRRGLMGRASLTDPTAVAWRRSARARRVADGKIGARLGAVVVTVAGVASVVVQDLRFLVRQADCASERAMDRRCGGGWWRLRAKACLRVSRRNVRFSALAETIGGGWQAVCPCLAATWF